MTNSAAPAARRPRPWLPFVIDLAAYIATFPSPARGPGGPGGPGGRPGDGGEQRGPGGPEGAPGQGAPRSG